MPGSLASTSLSRPTKSAFNSTCASVKRERCWTWTSRLRSSSATHCLISWELPSSTMSTRIMLRKLERLFRCFFTRALAYHSHIGYRPKIIVSCGSSQRASSPTILGTKSPTTSSSRTRSSDATRYCQSTGSPETTS